MRLVSLPAAALLLTAPLAAAPGSFAAVRCSFDDAPAVACRMTDQVGADGVHHLRFAAAGRRAEFVGSPRTGWWFGRFDGLPAAGFERSRGNVVFSTVDGRRRFAWWYPTEEHGRY